jgi:plasmid stability protein
VCIPENPWPVVSLHRFPPGHEVAVDRTAEIGTIGYRESKLAMMIELPDKLEAALKAQANAHGVSPAGYVCEVLERELAPSLEIRSSGAPFKTGCGMFAKYRQAPSAEEIDANRADMGTGGLPR